MRYVIGLGLFLWSSLATFAWDGATDDASWTELTNSVAVKRAELSALVEEAESAGVNTDYAYVSQVVLDRFDTYAQYDRNNPDAVYEAFTNNWWYTKVSDQNYHVNLPFNEMQACLEVAEFSIAELQAQLNDQIALQEPVDFSTGTMTFGDGSCLQDGKPVFPSDFTWMPDDDDVLQAFGRMGGTYYALSELQSDGTMKSWSLSSDVESVATQTERNIAFGQYFIGHTSLPSWMTDDYPELLDGARNFVGYDTDSPLIRNWYTNLFEAYLPSVCESQGDQPRMHLLANEPNWATREGGWLAENGVSANTMTNYRGWLEAKYATIDQLNETYGTEYADFYAAQDAMVMPIDPTAPETIQGGPVWYDWCRFNMYRINDFFTFLKNGAQGNDPDSAPATIKILGSQLSNSMRDDGLDMEYLAEMMDVTGADCHMAPGGLTQMTGSFDMTWDDLYACEWSDQAMMLDFYKSLYPDKPYFDSEWHGLDTGKWRHFSMSRDYIRSALWLGFTHGMNMIQSWVWGRDNDGSFDGVNSSFVGEILTQPSALDAYGRTMKELNAHAQTVTDLVRKDRDFLIYYCSDAAIQDATYVSGMQDVYEALKLVNVRVGFTTPVTIAELDPSSRTVVVPPTAFISDEGYAALEAFELSGGNVVLVNGTSASFQTNELGVAVSENTTLTPYASVDFDEVMVLAESLDSALEPLTPDEVIQIDVVDSTGQTAYGVLATQSVDPITGESTVVLINISKESLTVSLSAQSDDAGGFLNLITGNMAAETQVLDTYDVLLLQTDSSIRSVVYWGEPDGDTEIVASTQDFVVKNTTYVEDTAVNPVVGSDYYPESSERSAVFNATSSNTANSKQVVDSSYGDLIRSGKNNAGYEAMFVWENLLDGDRLCGLSAETRFSMYSGTGTGTVHWIVQKESGDWYASAGMDLTQYHANSSTFTSFSATDAAELDWFEFTPITAGVGTIGAAAGIDMWDVKSVGVYYDLSGSGENIYADLRYFNAEARSTGWNFFVVGYDLSGTALTDSDEDGVSDLIEFALGGNPTNAAITGVSPSVEVNSNGAVFSHLESTLADPGITYISEWTTNLADGSWSEVWDQVDAYSTDDPAYETVEYQILNEDHQHMFFRLQITQP